MQVEKRRTTNLTKDTRNTLQSSCVDDDIVVSGAAEDRLRRAIKLLQGWHRDDISNSINGVAQ